MSGKGKNHKKDPTKKSKPNREVELDEGRCQQVAEHISAITGVGAEEWVDWLMEDVVQGLKRRGKDVIASAKAFQLEFEESISALLLLNHSAEDDVIIGQVASIALNFVIGEIKGTEEKKAKGDDSVAATTQSRTDVWMRISEWLHGSVSNGIVLHYIPESFFHKGFLNNNKSSTCVVDEEELVLSVLTKEASRRLYQSENAGGTSELSEAISLELLSNLLVGCELALSEMEVDYSVQGSSKTDYCIEESGSKSRIGVSVTRAVEFQTATFGEKVFFSQSISISLYIDIKLNFNDTFN